MRECRPAPQRPLQSRSGSVLPARVPCQGALGTGRRRAEDGDARVQACSPAAVAVAQRVRAAGEGPVSRRSYASYALSGTSAAGAACPPTLMNSDC